MSMPVRSSAAPALPARATRHRGSAVRVQALFKKSASTQVKEPEVETEPKKKAVSMTPSVLNALDFAAPRSRRDAELLYDAKYGKRGEDGRMTPEQYQALRRKVIGTARDYWKDWVEEERVENTYYKPDSAGGTVPYLNVLIGIVVAMLGVTILVVAKTAS